MHGAYPRFSNIQKSPAAFCHPSLVRRYRLWLVNRRKSNNLTNNFYKFSTGYEMMRENSARWKTG